MIYEPSSVPNAFWLTHANFWGHTYGLLYNSSRVRLRPACCKPVEFQRLLSPINLPVSGRAVGPVAVVTHAEKLDVSRTPGSKALRETD